MDLARAPRRRPLTARKKGSGYENGLIDINRRDETPVMRSCDVFILVPRALLTRGATRGSGQIQNRKP